MCVCVCMIDCVHLYVYHFSSVTQVCLSLYHSKYCSMLDIPVHHQLSEPTQTHVHRIGDAIQSSHPLLSPSPPVFNLSSIRVFANKLVLCIRWPKYWSFSFSISPSNEYSGLISFRMDWLDLLATLISLISLKGLSSVFSNTTVQKHQFFSTKLSL